MSHNEPVELDRRRLLIAAMMGGGALAACSPAELASTESDDLWAGFDDRITERTLAEAEKLFGVEFTEAERRQILGGAVEVDEKSFFANQIASLKKRREYDIPVTLAPATRFERSTNTTASAPRE